MLRRWNLLLIANAMTLLLLMGVAFLAYSNGANDNFKGVASLFGSRTCGYLVGDGYHVCGQCCGDIPRAGIAEEVLRQGTRS